jgi:hypothetical protein
MGNATAALIEASDMNPVLRRSSDHTPALTRSGVGATANTTPAAVATPFPPWNLR